jgi:hypothetical protein
MQGFKQYLLEMEIPLFTDADFAPGVFHEKNINGGRLSYDVSGDTINLASLRVSRNLRNNGSARKAMTTFCQEADLRNLKIKLLASPLDKRTNVERLGNFYLSLGFRIVGRGNMLGHAIMLRDPK